MREPGDHPAAGKQSRACRRPGARGSQTQLWTRPEQEGGRACGAAGRVPATPREEGAPLLPGREGAGFKTNAGSPPAAGTGVTGGGSDPGPTGPEGRRPVRGPPRPSRGARSPSQPWKVLAPGTRWSAGSRPPCSSYPEPSPSWRACLWPEGEVPRCGWGAGVELGTPQGMAGRVQAPAAEAGQSGSWCGDPSGRCPGPRGSGRCAPAGPGGGEPRQLGTHHHAVDQESANLCDGPDSRGLRLWGRTEMNSETARKT